MVKSKDEKLAAIIVWVIIGILFLVITGMRILSAQLVYDDWKCVFKRCVVIMEEE